MEHPIKRESIHDSELTEQFEKKSCPARSSPTIPGSSSSIGAELRRSRTDGTLRDDNRQIYETAYRSSTKSNFRVRRSRIIVSPAFPRHEVCVCMCVCGISKERDAESLARIFWNILKLTLLDVRGAHSFLKRRSRVDRVVMYPPQIGLIGGEYRFLFRLTLELMNMHRVSLGFALILERSGACTGIWLVLIGERNFVYPVSFSPRGIVLSEFNFYF